MQAKPENPANGNICCALRLCYAIVEAETLRAAAVFILERQKKEKRAGLFLAAGAVSLSFAAFFTSAFVLSTIDFELVTTSSFVGNTEVFVANAEPDTANASDVNVKSDLKDFIKTPVLLSIGSTSEPVC